MEEFFSHFQEYLIIGLVLALFFKESLAEFIRAKLGLGDAKESVPAWGQRLIQYANHDTTEKLDKLIAMEEKEHEHAEALRENIRGIDRTLGEFREYGIKIRKE